MEKFLDEKFGNQYRVHLNQDVLSIWAAEPLTQDDIREINTGRK